ncbi:MAG TPA: NERD domain-containing protein [Ktedonobacterales bacterium]
MYPERIAADVKSSAERLLFEQLARQLPDDYVVMHSVKWLTRDRQHFDRDGEADFLVFHRDLGVLVLEVKGGRMRIDGATGRWSSIDREGHAHPLSRSPFDQARSNLYSLQAKLAEAPATRPYDYRLQRGVAFPDVVVGSSDIGLDGDREIILDSTDLNRLEPAIRRIIGVPDRRPVLSEAAMDALVETLQPTRVISRFGLGSQVLTAEERITDLTVRQYAILDILQSRPQAAIWGCAGSGKTMLALEKARRLANEGFRVLFTCFNINLAQCVSEQLRADDRTAFERIHVAHYHDLVRELCAKAGVVLPPQPTGSSEEIDQYFTEEMPHKLSEAIARLPDRFDAIIADEGQDFAELWWVTLMELLADSQHGVFYIFYDDNQRIYNQSAPLPIPDPPFHLTTNCRNTVEIHQQAVRYFPGDPKPTSQGPNGAHPDVIPIEAKGEMEALRKAFARLFTDEKLSASHVVVLTPRSERTSMLKEGQQVGSMRLTWARNPGPGQVQVCSIHGYKGLESPVVVLAELDRLHFDHRDELLYVATSRARSHLIILGQLPEPD